MTDHTEDAHSGDVIWESDLIDLVSDLAREAEKARFWLVEVCHVHVDAFWRFDSAAGGITRSSGGKWSAYRIVYVMSR